MTYFVYLAGSISGKSYADCMGWREEVELALASYLPVHIKTLNPLRGKEYLSGEHCIGDSYEETLLSSRRGIITRDRHDVQRCDILFANLLQCDRVSIGTVFELAWADVYGKPIIVAMEKDSVHWHAFVREVAGYIVGDVQDAVEIIKAICV